MQNTANQCYWQTIRAADCRVIHSVTNGGHTQATRCINQAEIYQ